MLLIAIVHCVSGLLFSGGINPVTYDDIYFGDSAMALFSGIFSVTRYFIEGELILRARHSSATSVNSQQIVLIVLLFVRPTIKA